MPDARVSVRCRVNGAEVEVTGHPMTRLLDVLRGDLHLTGTKEGCGEGECGACSVLLDGQLVNSCLLPLVQAEGVDIVTIEGVADGSRLHAVQDAFIACGGAQCGICTPGMVLAAISLLQRHPSPTNDEIRDGLAGNLCRCTGYQRIFAAVVEACQSSIGRAPGSDVRDSGSEDSGLGIQDPRVQNPRMQDPGMQDPRIQDPRIQD